jgi:hypothetical protein
VQERKEKREREGECKKESELRDSTKGRGHKKEKRDID